MQYIAFDSHKRYTLASVEDGRGNIVCEGQIQHTRGALTEFLARCERGSPVAVETIGNWYWIVDEIEAAGMTAKLVNARVAKLMMAAANKTDKLDCHGLNRLQRSGTLPTVWIPPGELRDLRDLPRTRMVLTRQRTRLKNRIHATLAKYGISINEEVSDLFGKRGMVELKRGIEALPPHTRFAAEQLLEQLQALRGQIKVFEQHMDGLLADSEDLKLLRTLPGVATILATVIALEVGDVSRFGSAPRLASYAGSTPRVHASGGTVRYGQVRTDVNRYLKWAYLEAASAVARNYRRRPYAHASRLYARVRERRGPQKAAGAVARHLAEATYWILKKKEPYREPKERGFVHGEVSAVAS
jgi:transposase